MITYPLPGTRSYQEALFPKPALLDPAVRKQLGLKTSADVIKHFTATSLALDGIPIEPDSLKVFRPDGAEGYSVSFTPRPTFLQAAEEFAAQHRKVLDEAHYGLALKGAAACKRTPAWNPMAGFPVNESDGPSLWLPCLPVGMPLANQRAVTLLHYPPIVAYRTANYLNNQTLRRWSRLLGCVGIPNADPYKTIIDVNPIAAPGSGESEYPNDYFPINLTSQFYDNDARGLTYVRSMLELMLDPPWNVGNPLTLPLLVCGSPLYDPQAPGWFRTRYKDQLPKDENGSPTVDVLQTGLVRINPDSPKLTPYMIANHMIAAGVTGQCTKDPSQIPNIQKYEAQDLVAASFLALYDEAVKQGHPFDPAEAKRQACLRWFGADNGDGAPNPPDQDDRLTICALAQVDLCFDPVKIAPMYTLEEARERCQKAGGASFSPCFGCKPLNGP
ncbi:hypothetical protein [Niveibacterium sp. SC-1]|uniref:hypothetical protein n=1 Tax=Niveibacterium sp. SC-1 TaxID=3135646 RepID=UPI00311F515D